MMVGHAGLAIVRRCGGIRALVRREIWGGNRASSILCEQCGDIFSLRDPAVDVRNAGKFRPSAGRKIFFIAL